MKNPLLAKKYAWGLVGALEDEAEFCRVQKEIESFVSLIRSREDLCGILTNPLLNTRKRAGIVREIIGRLGFLDKTIKFIALVVEHGRLENLPEIAAAVPGIWNEKQGVLTFKVSSVVALTELQKDRLKAELEHLERRPVSLDFQIDPTVIGGLSLRKGNIVFDVSVEGDLLRLSEQIREGWK